MGPLKQLTTPTPGSNEFHPNKVFNPAVEATINDLASQNLKPANPNPLSPLPGGVQANRGTTTAQVDPATGQTVTPTPIDPTVTPDPNILTA